MVKRFEGFDRKELSANARLARLKEEAPGLGSTRRLRTLALGGSLITLTLVAGMYFGLNTLRETGADPSVTTVPVESITEIPENKVEQLLERIEAEEAQAQAELEAQLKALEEVDLLSEGDFSGGNGD